MRKYRNTKTGAVIVVSSLIGGDWELVSESSPKEEVKEEKPVEEEKPKAKPKAKKK